MQREKYSVFFPFFKQGVVFIKKLFTFIFDVLKKATKDDIGARSANAAFFMTVSFVPFIMLLLSMTRFFPLDEANVIEQIVSVFPGGTRDFVTSFIGETYRKSGTALISITAVTTLWAASIGVHALVSGLNIVFCENESINYLTMRLKSMLYTLLIMALFVLCLVFFVFGKTIIDGIIHFVPWMFDVAPVILSARLIVGTLLLSVIFAILYTVIPARKTKLLPQFAGALVSAVGWVAFSEIFSYYYENIANYSYVYGSLSVLVFFMLWLFICIYILFIGAEVNRCIEEKIERRSLLG